MKKYIFSILLSLFLNLCFGNVVIPNSEPNPGQLQIVSDSKGGALVAWITTTDDFTTQTLKYAYLNSSGYVGPAQTLATDSSIFTFGLASDSNGNIIIIWDQYNTSTNEYKMYYAFKSQGKYTSFGTPQLFTMPSGDDYQLAEAHIKAIENGYFVAFVSLENLNTSSTSIYYTTCPNSPSGTFSSFENIGDIDPAVSLTFDASPNGNLLIVWGIGTGPTQISQFNYRFKPFGQAFGTTQTMFPSNPGDEVLYTPSATFLGGNNPQSQWLICWNSGLLNSLGMLLDENGFASSTPKSIANVSLRINNCTISYIICTLKRSDKQVIVVDYDNFYNIFNPQSLLNSQPVPLISNPIGGSFTAGAFGGGMISMSYSGDISSGPVPTYLSFPSTIPITKPPLANPIGYRIFNSDFAINQSSGSRPTTFIAFLTPDLSQVVISTVTTRISSPYLDIINYGNVKIQK